MRNVGLKQIGETVSKHFALVIFMLMLSSAYASGPSMNVGEINGNVEITGLPPFKGHSITLLLFPVRDSSIPPPFAGDPPTDAHADEEKIAEKIHFDREDNSGSIRENFRFRRPSGWYYVQVSVILYREHMGKKYAQVERFFFRKRPFEMSSENGKEIIFPISWPSTDIEELGVYGKIKPQKKPQ